MEFLPAWPLTITPLSSFGLLLLIGSLGGYLAHRISWLPSITGFMLVGFLVGPSGLGLLTESVLKDSRILIDITLALILYRLGSSLDLRFLRQSPRLLVIALVESTLTFSAVFTVLWLFQIPLALAALIAAILVSSSPAVLLHVAHEVGAKGPVTETAKSLVALNNLLSFLAFAFVVPVLLAEQDAGWQQIVLQPMYLLLGSALLGGAIAYGLHFLTSRTQTATQYKLALVVGALMLCLGLAQQLKLSALFAPLVVGIVVRSMEREEVVSALEFGAFELFFIVLFVFAGANLHFAELVAFAPVIMVLVAVRCAAKWFGVSVSSVLLGQTVRTGASSGLLLIPMAGLAIGLVQSSSQLVPEHAAVISAIVLGAVTVFETIGPPIASYAFRLAGETEAQASAAVAEQQPLHPWQAEGTVAVDLSALHAPEPADAVLLEQSEPKRFKFWRW
jgi:Kef-type K+ transport system membrane component KefB